MGVAYVKTTQKRQLHCPCSFFHRSQQRFTICLTGEEGCCSSLRKGNCTRVYFCPYPNPLPLCHGPSTHLQRALQNWGLFFFFSLVTESLSSSESVAFPVLYPLWFCSETRCFFKAFQQEAFDNLLVLSQVYIKAQQ